jgi:hypothetical protein
MQSLRRFLLRHRARIARLTAVAGVLTVGLLVSRELPRDVDVELMLGPKHAEIVEVRIGYLQDGEELHGVALSFPKGAPARVHHKVSLPAGELEVHAEARSAHGLAAANVARLQNPAQGPLRIHVAEPVNAR